MDTTPLHTGAAVVDLTERANVLLLGKDRAAFLHGLVTNDIKKLASGSSCRAALLTPKGKMVADLHVFATEDALVVDAEASLADTLPATFRKYLFFQEVTIEDRTAETAVLHVAGPDALAVLDAVPVGEGLVARIDRGGTLGYDLRLPVSRAPEVLAALAGRGAVEVSPEMLDAARVEAGIPRWGAELDETVLPNEAWLERTAISYSKGCYIGQEIVARIRTYGRVTRNLVRLDLDGAPEPAKDAAILKDDAKIGHVTSATTSERLGKVLALGYVKRDFIEDGTMVTIESEKGPLPATVRPL